jgi:hypothetical protein
MTQALYAHMNNKTIKKKTQRLVTMCICIHAYVGAYLSNFVKQIPQSTCSKEVLATCQVVFYVIWSIATFCKESYTLCIFIRNLKEGLCFFFQKHFSEFTWAEHCGLKAFTTFHFCEWQCSYPQLVIKHCFQVMRIIFWDYFVPCLRVSDKFFKILQPSFLKV